MFYFRSFIIFTVAMAISFSLYADDKKKYLKKGGILCSADGKDEFIEHFDKQNSKEEQSYDDLVDITKYFVDDMIQKGLCFRGEDDYKVTVLSKPYWHTGSLYRAFVNEFGMVLYINGDFYEK